MLQLNRIQPSPLRTDKMKESVQYILQILVFVALVLAIGTGGYLLIEDEMEPGQAFYMAVTAITPTQFDEVYQLSTPGRYFTVVLVFCGFGAVVAFATQFARLVIQSELEGVGIFTRKQMQRRISRMKNHYIICGFGEIGGAICSELADQKIPFIVINDDDSVANAITREGFAMVKGNPTSDGSLKEAEIERALGVIAVLPDDADNLFISLAARELNPKMFIIARGEDSSVEDRILRAGADIVVSPMQLGGRQIAELIRQQSNASSVIPAEETTSVLGLKLEAQRYEADEPVSLADFLNGHKAIGVAAIQRSHGGLEPTPKPESVIQPGDTLILIVQDSPAPHAPTLTGKKILLADDHRALRLLFARKLAAAGHDVFQATCGDEALALAEENRPDLIVLDVNMPTRNGYETCRALRQTQQFVDVPIILYSADETKDFLRMGQAAGATECLRKTSRSSELLAKIEEIFSMERDSTNASQSDSKISQPEDVDVPKSHASMENSDATITEKVVFDQELALENVEGDSELLSELVNVFLEDLPRQMQHLQTAVENQDWNAIEREAHTLKSAAGVLGGQRVSALAADIETKCRRNEHEQINQLHSRIQDQVELLAKSMEQICPASDV